MKNHFWNILGVSALMFCFSASGKITFPANILTENLTFGLTFTDIDTRPIEGALATITLDELKENLYELASDEYEGRDSGYPGDDMAATFIENKFEEYGIIPAYQDGYRQKFNISAGRGYTWNVVGYLPGTDPDLKDEVIVIGAHYDHLGKSGSRVYNGADDNGSGTVAIIEIAEACAEIRPQLRRTVVFIAFSAEEMGLIGSKFYTKNPLFDMSDTIYMVNLDMIGYMESYGRLKFIGGSSSSYIKSLINSIAARYPDVTPYLSGSSMGGSDHSPFLSSGVPAVFLHTGLHNNYHTTRDTVEKIDYQGVEWATKIAFEMVWNLSFKDEKPVLEKALPSWDPSWELDHGLMPFESPFRN